MQCSHRFCRALSLSRFCHFLLPIFFFSSSFLFSFSLVFFFSFCLFLVILVPFFPICLGFYFWFIIFFFFLVLICYLFLFNRGIRVNVYKLHFSSSHFSSQLNNRNFSSIHFSTPNQTLWEKTKISSILPHTPPPLPHFFIPSPLLYSLFSIPSPLLYSHFSIPQPNRP